MMKQEKKKSLENKRKTLALNNGKVFINGKLVKKNILIEKGIILKISEKPFTAFKEINCKNKIILPGAIDVHVHFRTPGFENKEDWFSGSLAALHGGVTTVMDMPNTNPPVITVKTFENKKKFIAENAIVNFDIYMAATNDNINEINKIKNLRGVKLYYGSTTGNIILNQEDKIIELFKLSKKKNFVVVAHAEDETEIQSNLKKFAKEKNPGVHPKIRNEEAEAKAIKNLLKLQKKIGNKLHIAHISSAKGLELIKKAKKRKNGNKITCETTPNYLFLDSSKYPKLKNLMKCNPAIKSIKNRKALFNGIKNKTINIVSTDHAPHELSEKNKTYWNSPSGIPGIETMLPLLINSVNKKEISLKRIVEIVSENPSKIFNWKNKGFIKKGFSADLVIINMKKSFTIKNEELFTKAQYSPFNGQRIKGVIETTILRGDLFG